MISNFSNAKKLVGVFCSTLAVCLVGYLMLKPTNGKQKNSDLDSLDNLVSIELSNSTNKQNKPSFFEKPQVASHTSAHPACPSSHRPLFTKSSHLEDLGGAV